MICLEKRDLIVKFQRTISKILHSYKNMMNYPYKPGFPEVSMNIERKLITVKGHVQGVGFRMFVYRLASHYNLVGYVCNTYTDVFIDIQGDKNAIATFLMCINSDPPRQSTIKNIVIEDAELVDNYNFEIK